MGQGKKGLSTNSVLEDLLADNPQRRCMRTRGLEYDSSRQREGAREISELVKLLAGIPVRRASCWMRCFCVAWKESSPTIRKVILHSWCSNAAEALEWCSHILCRYSLKDACNAEGEEADKGNSLGRGRPHVGTIEHQCASTVENPTLEERPPQRGLGPSFSPAAMHPETNKRKKLLFS